MTSISHGPTMSDQRDDLQAIDDAARSLLPELTRRLEEHGLGELEVRRGTLRLRVAAASTPRAASVGGAGPAAEGESGAPSSSVRDGTTPATGAAQEAAPSRQPILSPAVGIFVYAEGLGPGLAVTPGQPVGHVDMLGVHYDVRAHRAGTVASLVTESGEAVEYGQLLVELDEGSAA